MAHLYGHEHSTTFRIPKNNNGVMFLAPALAPAGLHINPAFGKRFHYDNSTLKLLSYE